VTGSLTSYQTWHRSVDAKKGYIGPPRRQSRVTVCERSKQDTFAPNSSTNVWDRFALVRGHYAEPRGAPQSRPEMGYVGAEARGVCDRFASVNNKSMNASIAPPETREGCFRSRRGKRRVNIYCDAGGCCSLTRMVARSMWYRFALLGEGLFLTIGSAHNFTELVAQQVLPSGYLCEVPS
jgi:hypothetical protein